MSDELATVRLLFADDGSFHHEEVQIPAGAMAGYDRLIDCLMEDPTVLKRLHVDVSRVCSAELTNNAAESTNEST
ncbi:MAG: hypothetical protein CME12_07935 [Gemmatimonadetes bacterium]|nr:hypothetical protein [Gemmatimonadota bacterium]